jgi:hypothetical protein
MNLILDGFGKKQKILTDGLGKSYFYQIVKFTVSFVKRLKYVVQF